MVKLALRIDITLPGSLNDVACPIHRSDDYLTKRECYADPECKAKIDLKVDCSGDILKDNLGIEQTIDLCAKDRWHV